jgi:hypothetical protein
LVKVRSLVRALLVAAVAGTTLPSPARADDATEAKDAFERGRQLRARGDCAGAIPLLQRAYEIYPAGLGSVRNRAQCEESLGRFASARRSWLMLKQALATTTDRKYAGWDEDADRAAARLERKVAWLTIDVIVTTPAGAPAPGADVAITVDGQPIAASSIGAALDRDPGPCVIRADAPTAVAPEEERCDLAPGESKQVSLRIVVAPAAPPAQPPAVRAEAVPLAPPAPLAERHEPGGSRAGAWVSLGAGIAGIAGAGIAFAVRQSALSDMSSSCSNYASSPCPASSRAEVQSAMDRGHTASTLADVLAVAGAVGLGAGAVLFVTSRPSHASATLVVSPAGMFAMGSF